MKRYLHSILVLSIATLFSACSGVDKPSESEPNIEQIVAELGYDSVAAAK